MKAILLFISELLWMGQQLFSKIDVNSGLKMRQSRFFPSKKFAYLMWCGTLVYRDERLAHISTQSYNHEMIHLCQAAAKGSWFRYYICYLYEWIKGRPLKKPFIESYFSNPFEIEAYANEHDLSYTLHYNPRDIRRYHLKNRRRVLAANRSRWNEFIRNL